MACHKEQAASLPVYRDNKKKKVSEFVVCCYLCEYTYLSAVTLRDLLFGKPELADSLASMYVKLYCIILKSECRMNVAPSVKWIKGWKVLSIHSSWVACFTLHLWFGVTLCLSLMVSSHALGWNIWRALCLMSRMLLLNENKVGSLATWILSCCFDN